MTGPRTLYDKIWDAHAVAEDDGETLLYIDLHLLHEVTSPQAFAGCGFRVHHAQCSDLIVRSIPT